MKKGQQINLTVNRKTTLQALMSFWEPQDKVKIDEIAGRLHRLRNEADESVLAHHIRKERVRLKDEADTITDLWEVQDEDQTTAEIFRRLRESRGEADEPALVHRIRKEHKRLQDEAATVVGLWEAQDEDQIAAKIFRRLRRYQDETDDEPTLAYQRNRGKEDKQPVPEVPEGYDLDEQDTHREFSSFASPTTTGFFAETEKRKTFLTEQQPQITSSQKVNTVAPTIALAEPTEEGDTPDTLVRKQY